MSRQIHWLGKILGATEPVVEYHIIMQIHASDGIHLGHVPATYYNPEEAINAFKQTCEVITSAMYGQIKGYDVTIPETIEVGRIYEIMRKGDNYVLLYIVKDIED